MAAGGRKRKFVLDESDQLKRRRLDVTASPPASSGNSTCESVSCGEILASFCCSSTRPSLEFSDLEENAVVNNNVEEIATSAGHSVVDFRERREKMPPSSEVQAAESGELESTARPPESYISRRRAEKMPTEDELDDFFVAAEKNLQKQFIDKYNFDIVKDEPLEGRYEWDPVQLKP